MYWKSECEEKMTIEAIAGAVSVEQRRRREAREERPTRARKRDRIKKFVSAVFSGRNNNSNSNDDGDDSLLPRTLRSREMVAPVQSKGYGRRGERTWRSVYDSRCARGRNCARSSPMGSFQINRYQFDTKSGVYC